LNDEKKPYLAGRPGITVLTNNF